jgi:hypothetical protein
MRFIQPVERRLSRFFDKILPEAERGVEVFFGCLLYPCSYVFLSARISAAAQHSFSKLSSAFALHEICEQNE